MSSQPKLREYIMKTTIELYSEVISRIEDYKRDAIELIEKKKSKLSNNDLRNARVNKSIEQLKMVVNFECSSCDAEILAISQLINEVRANEINALHFVSKLNQSRV